ncbi:MAG: exonuclease domain-containing protein [Actinomycetaceae bacterium]|nr:exonuclease domain-containing protein [Actinomycetaceae bacterium]
MIEDFRQVSAVPKAVHSRTFIVVDVETTGLRATDAITEIGAVRIVDGVIMDSFTSLVDPQRPIPPAVTSLTGITDSMVAQAPSVKTVIEDFISWAKLDTTTDHDQAGVTLLAHNANFDIGFITRACAANDVHWPTPHVLDTLSLARTHLPRPLVGNYRLATLVNFFQVRNPAAHRALADAYACAAVFLGIVTRLTQEHHQQGLDFTYQDLLVAASPSPYEYRHQLSLTRTLPTSAGVYIFRTDSGIVLYVGSATNLRNRVRSYFGSSENRERILRSLGQISKIETIVTKTVLEARVVELQAIREHQPILNRSSRHQDETVWLLQMPEGITTTHSLQVLQASRALGPFRHTAQALRARAAIAVATGMDEFEAMHLSGRPLPLPGTEAMDALRGHSQFVTSSLHALMASYAREHRFEAAQRIRVLLDSYLEGVRRQRDTARVATAAIAWARPLDTPSQDASAGSSRAGKWRLHLAIAGKLVSTSIVDCEASELEWHLAELFALADPQYGSLIEKLRLRWEQKHLPQAPYLDAGKYLEWASWEEVRELTRDLESSETKLMWWDGPIPWASQVSWRHLEADLGGNSAVSQTKLTIDRERPDTDYN